MINKAVGSNNKTTVTLLFDLPSCSLIQLLLFLYYYHSNLHWKKSKNGTDGPWQMTKEQQGHKVGVTC